MEISQHARYTCTFCGKVWTIYTLWMLKILMVSKSNRIQSRELLLESGTARHAEKPLLAVLGLFQQQLLPQSAGTFYCVLHFHMKANLFSLFQYRTTSVWIDANLDVLFFPSPYPLCSYDTWSLNNMNNPNFERINGRSECVLFRTLIYKSHHRPIGYLDVSVPPPRPLPNTWGLGYCLLFLSISRDRINILKECTSSVFKAIIVVYSRHWYIRVCHMTTCSIVYLDVSVCICVPPMHQKHRVRHFGQCLFSLFLFVFAHWSM